MEALHKILSNAQRINVGDLFFFIFSKDEVQDFVIKLQKEQLGRGDRSDDVPLPDYSLVSIDKYDKPTTSNPFFDPVGGDAIRLYGDGDFYKSIKTTSVSKASLIVSGQADFIGDDGEQVNLVARYGSEILGLDTFSISELTKFITPFTARYIHEFITTR